MNDAAWFVKKFGSNAVYIRATEEGRFTVRAGGYYGADFESLADTVGEAMKDLRAKFEKHWLEEAEKELKRAQANYEAARARVAVK